MLIVDMPMPRGCAECPLKAFGGACMIPVFGNGVNYKPFEKRPDWCPIKGVLPEEHGDLIDRDELKKIKVYSPELHEYIVPLAYVDWQQAVIAARKERR